MGYNFTAIEKKWQQYWLEHKSFAALDPADAGPMPKAYVLDMFPYPSGSGLHVGHPEGYTATDIVSRYLRMKGYNVLHPMGWDAFGLPAEQYAVEKNVHPRVTTENNIANFRRQIRMLGLSYDWDREVNTTDPAYYKWTQWIFLQLFNSYFDPVAKKALPIARLIHQLENDNYVVGPDGSIHLNPAQEGMEALAGEVRVERTWQEMSNNERADVIDGQRLAYRSEVPVNWCPALGTVLANEEVIDGKSERGGHPVERRPMTQWMLRISAYSDRLLEDLNTLDWPESLKEMQRNWIGRSVGAEVDFEIGRDGETERRRDEVGARDAETERRRDEVGARDAETERRRDEVGGTAAETDLHSVSSSLGLFVSSPEEGEVVTVFTTRPDTLYGATYMVLAPEHPLVQKITTAAQKAEVEAYQRQVAGRSERDRMAEAKEKTGVFTGAYAINPVNEAKIPVWIADYVLMGYGTGAIMAVPAHDQRDYEFATKFNLPILPVVKPADGKPAPEGRAFEEEGIAINSPLIEGLRTAEAQDKITKDLAAEGIALRSVKYKLRDWLFSRQRYWGEPFPILLDDEDHAIAVEEGELPVVLPEMEDFKPTGTPEPPLSKVKEWVKVSDRFRRETNTMPQWAGSCWYYLRYIDPKNPARFVDPEKEKYWMPVDLYVGGVEHAVLHLLYARFWHKVLFDLGHVSTREPFAKLVNQGLILGPMEYHFFETADGKAISTADLRNIEEEATPQGVTLVGIHRQTGQKIYGKRVDEALVEKKGDAYVLRANSEVRVDARSFKMSKSRGNVVNPDAIVKDYGADCFRLYEMYMGPLEAQKPWNTRDIVGMQRFLDSVWRNVVGEEGTEAPRHEGTKVTEDAVPEALHRMMHRVIKKVGEDIEALRFNTAIAELIKLNNELRAMEKVPRKVAETLALLLAPMAPHIAEEIWQRLGNTKSLARAPWPKFDPAKLVEASIELPVQVNGKVRDKIVVAADASEAEVFTAALASEKVRPWVEGKQIANQRYISGKLVSIAVK